jgi:hypothetical protein
MIYSDYYACYYLFILSSLLFFLSHMSFILFCLSLSFLIFDSRFHRVDLYTEKVGGYIGGCSRD